MNETQGVLKVIFWIILLFFFLILVYFCVYGWLCHKPLIPCVVKPHGTTSEGICNT